MKTISQEDLNGYPIELELEDREQKKTLDSIQEIIEEFIPQGSTYAFTLHKWDESLKRWPQISKWRNTMPPDKHDIGVMYGSGRYQFYLKWPDKTKKLGYAVLEEKFDLHKSYDELKARSDAEKRREEQIATVMPVAGANNEKMMELMLAQANAQVATIVALFSKMLENQSHIRENPMDKYFPLLLEGQIKTKEIDSERMYTMFTKGIEMGSLNQIENSKDTSWKDLLKDLIPQLPGMVNNAAKMFVPRSSIRKIALSDPRAQQILAAPNGKEEFVKEMIAQHGEETAMDTLQKAGLDDLIPGAEKTINDKMKVW